MQRACERCGTFLSDDTQLHCIECEALLRKEAEAAARHGPLAILSTALFVAGITGFATNFPFVALTFPAGIIFGIASLARRRGNQSLAITGIVLNALVILAFVIIGTLAGWAA